MISCYDKIEQSIINKYIETFIANGKVFCEIKIDNAKLVIKAGEKKVVVKDGMDFAKAKKLINKTMNEFDNSNDEKVETGTDENTQATNNFDAQLEFAPTEENENEKKDN